MMPASLSIISFRRLWDLDKSNAQVISGQFLRTDSEITERKVGTDVAKEAGTNQVHLDEDMGDICRGIIMLFAGKAG